MLKRKKVREKGKIKLSRYFQEFEGGEKVAVVRELAEQTGFPKRMQGRTGEVEKKRGQYYVIKIKDGNRGKKFIIHPVHLKKLKTLKKVEKEK